MNYTVDKTEKSTGGFDANVAGAIAYLFVFFSGIYFLVTEKRSRFVRFHAMQSTAVFLPLFVLQVLLSEVGALAALSTLVGLVSIGIWAYMMYKAYYWELFRLPIVGDIAAKELEKPVPS